MSFSSNSTMMASPLLHWAEHGLGVLPIRNVPAALGILVATLGSFLVYLSHRPTIDKRAPAFTTDAMPLIGSWHFFVQKMGFWKRSVAESKTGNFSFWLGKNHVVGVSGEAARKQYLEHRGLHQIKGIALIGHGPDFIEGTSTVIHPIWKGTGSSGRTYAQRRLVDLQKPELLARRLPDVARDARSTLEALQASANKVINPSTTCFRIVVKQGTRLVGSDELADDPIRMAAILRYVPILQFNNSLHLLAVPYLSYFSPSYWLRRYGRRGLTSLVTPFVDSRMKPGAPRTEDALQYLIDQGDSQDYIREFMISMLFIAGANTGVISGSLLNVVAAHKNWQDRIYVEIKTAATAHYNNHNNNATKKKEENGNGGGDEKDQPSLVQMLDLLPLEGWEKMSASLDLCYKEMIRMWVAFPMGRYNDTADAIPIPGTDEVIPPGSYACYNTVDVHYNENLYPEPMKWDPDRWLEGRKEAESEIYGYMGWGGGRHPCIGMRWAKLQQNIIMAYALALYEWTGCDAEGNAVDVFSQPSHALNHIAPRLPQGTHVKFAPRQE